MRFPRLLVVALALTVTASFVAADLVDPAPAHALWRKIKRTWNRGQRGAKRLVSRARRTARRVVEKVKTTAKKVGRALAQFKEKVVSVVGQGVSWLKTAYRTPQQLWNEVKNLKAPLLSRWRKTRARVDLRATMASYGVTIKKQYYSTCMAHAMSSAMEYALIPYLGRLPRIAKKVLGKAGAKGLRVSRKHIYWYSRRGLRYCSRKSTADFGSWALQAAGHLKKTGTFLEQYWPFDWWDPADKRFKNCLEAATGGKPSSQALANRHFFLDRYYYLPAISLRGKASIRNARDVGAILQRGYPVVATVFTVDGVWKRTGHVEVPRWTKLPSNAHYIMLVGYDDAKKHFIFANSWGTDWGQRGFGFLPYKYLERYAIEGLMIRSVRVK